VTTQPPHAWPETQQRNFAMIGNCIGYAGCSHWISTIANVALCPTCRIDVQPRRDQFALTSYIVAAAIMTAPNGLRPVCRTRPLCHRHCRLTVASILVRHGTVVNRIRFFDPFRACLVLRWCLTTGRDVRHLSA